ncbi:Target of rapamycin complex 1 subunit kog1 [Exophiala dermatitidis]|uniref:Target of rapamycin complex 1 subunit kog1 n=1 Tax=Exophiala dermatitidis TaxID=5970 RepID=A0AAN6EZ20_EXODE|nr:Target of rapamycin complex 1 subunit kog1 [Exophiala dermatitidis]KAJ4524404.1 Target of rapamycin complex 1 subunit kog1 [Exophiala dermatitidis]KAJ4525326.1 Target of rapamycin complex 1 subunit kog1 [Exophiala dermatitidis]KAJ4536637.1 Target of rapamycin complex 1 subunit kog1 [Exophiala dermatitidis]KAJ4555763.1 Target of rapamycin complex 1 subunit kog1 [Exophiala dermatitidis]
MASQPSRQRDVGLGLGLNTSIRRPATQGDTSTPAQDTSTTDATRAFSSPIFKRPSLVNGTGSSQQSGLSSSQRIIPKETEDYLTARPAPLHRTKSDLGPRRKEGGPTSPSSEDKRAHIRHGWDDEYTSNEYLSLLHSTFYMYYTEKRHETNGSLSEESKKFPSVDWRMKDRMKTVSAALAICLNIGVDPPDVIKTNPCAKLEAWVDPTANSGGTTKTMEQIGKRLQEQYESLSLRTRYKQYLDPSIDETKRFCISLRRNAKDERVLFHYNGHGVPLPTASGEIWVFNKNYTQYIPVGIYDLQSWLGGPSLFVYDVSHAGNIVYNFDTFLAKHEKENEEIKKRDPNAPVQNYGDCIQLAACGRTEMLPSNPDLPADLFTCCLTTPIDIALRFFVLQNPLQNGPPLDDGKIPVPGRLQDRRSPLGELNWIFTAITDTIAWNSLPRHLFKKLFRQDLMVAALFRNFLLSERIMRANHCHPISSPPLPETHRHPLWQSWDLAMEMVLAQLPMLREAEEGKRVYEYQHSTFFAEQLTAFEVYLSSGPTKDRAPDQLPIVLQVLLSQVHRLRALILLSKFLDLGPWAVHLALSIGIFPYVVKLLQAASIELKPVMVFIWARIMAVDYTVQGDLLKDNGISYFISIMNPRSDIPVGNASEHRAMCAFIVATFCKKYPPGQTVCLLPEVFQACLLNTAEPENPLLRQWSCLCLSMLWCDYADAKWMGIRCMAHARLCELSLDPVPEVRAAMLHALTNFLGIPDLTDQVSQIEEGIASSVLFMTSDGSTLVRKELLVFLSTFVQRYENKFMVVAYEQMVEERDRHPYKDSEAGGFDTRDSLKAAPISANTIYGSIWVHLLVLSVDPHPEIARNASIIVDCVHEALLSSPMGKMATAVVDDLLKLSKKEDSQLKKVSSRDSLRVADRPPGTPPPGLQKQQSYLSLSLKRAGSSLRNLAFGYSGDSASTSKDNTPPSSPGKPREPVHPLNTPRGRLPPEWSRPPETPDSTSTSGTYHPAHMPTSAGFTPLDPKVKQSIPLQSALLEWSTEYFREPQMRPNDPDEPGSADYNSRLWRRNRNEKIIADNQPLKGVAGSSKWTRLQGFLNNQNQPMNLVFHQFDDHLAVTDDRDTVSIWDFQRNEQLSRFSNGNPAGSRINDAKFLNEDDQPLLMVGSSDGVLKVYRNYHSSSEVKVITAFRALTELIPSNKNAGLVFDWQQGQGKALVAGDVKVIKVWNAATELCVGDIPARSSSCVTSLTSDQVAGQIFIAGFGDGVVRVFDQRLNPRTAMVKIWREHRQWITNIHMQRGGVRELISGARNGEVKLWDLRSDSSVLTLNATSGSKHDHSIVNTTAADTIPASSATTLMRSLSVHEHAPVFAVGTDKHEVRTFNTNGDSLGVFEPLSSRLSQVVGGSLAGRGYGSQTPIVATAYHPHRMLLACSALGDGHVSLVSY